MQYLLPLLLMVGTARAMEELPDPKHPEPSLQKVNATARPDGAANTTKEVDPRLVNVPFTVCKLSEVFVVNKGCVDRKIYMKDIVLSTWNDKSVEKARILRLEESEDCAINEVKTETGCEPLGRKLRDETAPRAIVSPNYIHGNKIYSSKEAIPQTGEKEDLVNGKPENTVSSGSTGSTGDSSPPKETIQGRRLHVTAGGSKGEGGTDTDQNYSKEMYEALQRVIGHNRKRTYAFLPGRLLKTHRKCRPYEVLGKGGRCIRKKGKVGFYKHQSHVYGLQNRHRHPASYRNRRGKGRCSKC